MDISNGKCVICSENSLVLSGKDKQRFVELLKEHYFDVNQINNNKFLSQFKEKRSEASICITCAYVIKCYANIKSKFQEEKTKFYKKCSLCHTQTNLIKGNNQFIKDANNLLKNATKNKKVPRITLVCLDCYFCITSWNKIKKTIAEYQQDDTESSNAMNGNKKRKHSVEDDSDLESESAESVSVLKRSLRKSEGIDVKEKTAVNKQVNKDKNYKTSANKKHIQVSGKKKPKLQKNNETEDYLKHLSNVSTAILSQDICLTDKATIKIKSDDRMMFDIAYIFCETNNLEGLMNTNKCKRTKSEDEKDLSLSSNDSSMNLELTMKTTKRRKSTRSKSQVKPSYEDNKISEVSEKIKKPMTRNNNRSRKSSEIIEISDTESETVLIKRSSKKSIAKTPTRVSLRVTKGISPRSRIEKVETVDNKSNKCSTCKKQYAKKYKLKLHELEHEMSFKPVVRLQKENNEKKSGCTSDTKSETADKIIPEAADTENNYNEESEEFDEIEKTCNATKVNNGEKSTQNTDNYENEKDNYEETQNNLDTLIKQNVNDAILSLEKEMDKNTTEPLEQENDTQEPSFNKEDQKKERVKTTQNLDNKSDDKFSDNTQENQKDEGTVDSENEKTKNNVENSDSEESNSRTNKENEASESLNENSKTKNENCMQSANENSGNLENEAVDDVTRKSANDNNENLQKIINEENDMQGSDTDNDAKPRSTQKKIIEKTKTNDSENSAELHNEDTINDTETEQNTEKAKSEERDTQKESEDKHSNNFKPNEDNNIVIGSDDDNEDEANEENIQSKKNDDCSENSNKNKSNKQDILVDIVTSEDDSLTNSEKIEEDSEIQNLEQDETAKTVESIINEGSQIEISDDNVSNDERNVEKLKNTKNKSESSEQFDNIENKSDEEFVPADESEETNSQSSLNSPEKEESDMEPLKMSPDSPKNKNKEIIHDTNSDKFKIVENLLQNLGA